MPVDGLVRRRPFDLVQALANALRFDEAFAIREALREIMTARILPVRPAVIKKKPRQEIQPGLSSSQRRPR
ncbi:hypothetical protein IAI58_22725 (plasmid) [Roseomonas marmotae]|uniref:hypothetical protein n=1 Tax=Roseomonas marmotae TaxID=2768161 RepID=UPI001AD6B298|nr:hypothetical protein [Roseomonas marmotae]QTI82167.1 hypothetical protein IAI58_22725 [Roseomonas marmotae]